MSQKNLKNQIALVRSNLFFRPIYLKITDEMNNCIIATETNEHGDIKIHPKYGEMEWIIPVLDLGEFVIMEYSSKYKTLVEVRTITTKPSRQVWSL